MHRMHNPAANSSDIIGQDRAACGLVEPPLVLTRREHCAVTDAESYIPTAAQKKCKTTKRRGWQHFDQRHTGTFYTPAVYNRRYTVDVAAAALSTTLFK